MKDWTVMMRDPQGKLEYHYTAASNPADAAALVVKHAAILEQGPRTVLGVFSGHVKEQLTSQYGHTGMTDDMVLGLKKKRMKFKGLRFFLSVDTPNCTNLYDALIRNGADMSTLRQQCTSRNRLKHDCDCIASCSAAIIPAFVNEPSAYIELGVAIGSNVPVFLLVPDVKRFAHLPSISRHPKITLVYLPEESPEEEVLRAISDYFVNKENE